MDVNDSRWLLATALKGKKKITSASDLGHHIQNTLANPELSAKVLNLLGPDVTFNKQAFQTKLSHCKTKEDYSVFTGSGNYKDFVAIYCGYADIEDFFDNASQIPKKEIDSLLERCLKIPRVKTKSTDSSLDLSDYIKRPAFAKMQSYYKELELKSAGLQINCVSYSLNWTLKFILNHITQIEKNSNVYRYILTEEIAPGDLKKLSDLFKRDGLKSKILIKKIYGGQFKNTLEACKVGFPIYNDIVIYQDYGQDANIYHYKEAIIGVTPGHIGEENFVTVIPPDRGNKIMDWFEETWEKLQNENLI